MTKVMVQSAVGESFSFSEKNFNHIQSENKSQTLIGDSNELDDSTIIFNDNMDTDSENTICGSNSKDSVVTSDIQDSSNHTIKSNIFREDFEFMATETTVINATYNVISQSAVRGITEIPTVGKHKNPSNVMASERDKSRVIVQILTSDAEKSVKSQDIIKNNCTNIENHSIHSFRDDVFKILSKSQTSKIDLGNSSKEENKTSDAVKAPSIFQRVVSQIKDSTQIERNRRKRSLKSFFLFGGGPKISEIECVSTNLQTATSNALRIVHYVLYDKYGLCSSELQLSQTRKNILRFCGYPFDQNSQEFAKRANCLKKIPRPILYEVHRAIFGKTSLNSRMLMVQQLMEFFLKPKRYSRIVDKMKQNMQFMLDEEYNKLKETALRGPLPTVSVQRLQMVDVERIKNKLKMNLERNAEAENEDIAQKRQEDRKPSSYSLPAYILKGPGKKLKYFPPVVRNIKSAGEKAIHLLHYIMYGRVESKSIEVCRRNILEFSGFLKCQTDFIAERKSTLLGLNHKELLELCKIFCLRGKTLSRSRKIGKIMEYLQVPFNPATNKRLKRKSNHEDLHSVLSQSRCITSEPVIHKSNQDNLHDVSYQSRCVISEPSEKYSPEPDFDDSETVSIDRGLRLRDFKTICSNIECSATADLTELNDLLFIKPCDETEIHEKILNFTRFGFPEDSIHYHYRKTLLFYMGPCIVRKIAKLLDIENSEMVQSQEVLSSSILNFLMEKKTIHTLHARSRSLSLPVSSFKNSYNDKPKSQRKLSLPVSSFNNIFADKTESQERLSLPVSSYDNTFTDKPESEGILQSKIIQQQKKSVVIHRLSKSSTRTDLCESSNNALVPASMRKINDISSHGDNVAKDDSVPLRVFIHHPTDQELKLVIHGIIKESLWHITLGELVEKVYQYYPKFNLLYRENFIKAEARQMLSELRSDAFNIVQHMSFSQLPM